MLQHLRVAGLVVLFAEARSRLQQYDGELSVLILLFHRPWYPSSMHS
jgi:hypothetical protein